MEKLAVHGFLVFLANDAGQVDFVGIPKFLKHQKLHCREKDSEIKLIMESREKVRPSPEKVRPFPEMVRPSQPR